MRRLYVKFALTLQALIIIIGLFFYLALHPQTTDLIAQKVLKANGVTYRHLKGSLLYGFQLDDLTYQNAFYAKHLTVRYSLFSLISSQPTIEEIILSQATINPKAFPQESNHTTDPNLFIPPILIQKIHINDTTIQLPNQEKVSIDLHTKNLLFKDENVTIEAFQTKIRTPYALGNFQGTFEHQTITAEGTLSPKAHYLSMANDYFTNLPNHLPVRLTINPKRVHASTYLKEAVEVKEANLSIQNLHTEFTYHFEKESGDLQADYHLKHPYLATHIHQTLHFNPNTMGYTSHIQGEITQSHYPLPSPSFEANITGEKEALNAIFSLYPFKIYAQTDDYRTITLHATAQPYVHDYIKYLPSIFIHQTIGLEANATAILEPQPKIDGRLALDSNGSTLHSTFEVTPNRILVQSVISPKNPHQGLWKVLPPTMVERTESFLFISKDQKIFNLSTSKNYLTLFEHRGKITGWANIGHLNLSTHGRIFKNGDAHLYFTTQIHSLQQLLNDFNLSTSDLIVDAEVTGNLSLELDKRFKLNYTITVPWYFVQLDTQTIYYGLDSQLKGVIHDRKIHINHYTIDIQKHRFEQSRDSILYFDENLTLWIDQLAILDHGVLHGSFDLKTSKGTLKLEGKNVHYHGVEGNITTNLDLAVNLSPKSMSAEGEIQIVDATIRFEPPKVYTVNDEDIIIIQDIKPPSHTQKRLNIHIFSTKPLRYTIPMVHASFIPDITIWKESNASTVLLGMVRVVDGSIDVAEKHFTILPSEIYFAGTHPINPYLDLHILHTIDLNKFHIYVSHTLSNPVFLFSSEPPMSQNDIMSYILFGEPANGAFQTGDRSESSLGTMLVGAGLKRLLGSATGIRFDTLNILNKSTGGFGIEVGKRINPRIRIIYRNDTVSSFIIQYKASKTLRIDVDVRDTGQGFNLLYVKDIKAIKHLIDE